MHCYILKFILLSFTFCLLIHIIISFYNNGPHLFFCTLWKCRMAKFVCLFAFETFSVCVPKLITWQKSSNSILPWVHFNIYVKSFCFLSTTHINMCIWKWNGQLKLRKWQSATSKSFSINFMKIKCNMHETIFV